MLYLFLAQISRLLVLLLCLGNASSSTALAMEHKKNTRSENKTIEQPIPVKQCTSINQCAYETNEAQNILKGYNLCGLFATHNGLNMLVTAMQGKQPADLCDVASFNTWLSGKEVVAAAFKNMLNNTNQRIHDFGDGQIFALILDLKNESKANISVFGSNNFSQRKTDPNRLEKDIYENVNNFRTTGCPQLILFVNDSHWIAIILTPSETWVADSWGNQSRKNCPDVQEISDFFRSEYIPTQEERRQMGLNKTRVKQAELVILLDSDSASSSSDDAIQPPPTKRRKVDHSKS